MDIAICDNEASELQQISALVQSYRAKRPHCPLQAHFFRSGAELLSALDSRPPFDLYLLDVLMPGMSGIQLADRLLALQRKPRIVFLTSSAEYALDAFRVHARNYLLKPLNRSAFFAMMDEVLPAPTRDGETAITIPAAQNVDLTLPASAVAYAECAAHTVRYHLTDATMVESRTLRVPFTETVAPLLATGHFLLIHRSFAVNLEQVQRVSETTVRLKGGTELAIARLRQREIRTAYIDYLSRSGWTEMP